MHKDGSELETSETHRYDDELVIQSDPIHQKFKLIVVLLAALANAIGIPSGIAILSKAHVSDAFISHDCEVHLLDTEVNGLRQINRECNIEFRLLIIRLERHLQEDDRVLNSFDER